MKFPSGSLSTTILLDSLLERGFLIIDIKDYGKLKNLQKTLLDAAASVFNLPLDERTLCSGYSKSSRGLGRHDVEVVEGHENTSEAFRDAYNEVCKTGFNHMKEGLC